MKAFRQDSPFNDFMSTLGDLAVVNMIWLVCCLPIVTIGASTSAMFDLVRGLRRQEDAHILRRFFRAFGRRFTTSLVLTLLYLTFIGLSAFDLWYASRAMEDTDLASLAYGVTLTLICLVLAGTAFVFPLASSGGLSAWKQVKRSARLALLHPMTALVMTALQVLPVLVAVLIPGGLPFTVFFWSIILTSASAWLDTVLMDRAGIGRG